MVAKSGQMRKEGISHFVLVHGACHGAWCWYKVSHLLRHAGHVVTAVDLGGAGLNPIDGEGIGSLAEYNQPLVDFMEALPHGDGDGAEEEKVILVGHSFGGVNLTCTMEQFPHKISAAVFVTAYMPLPGTTSIQLLKQVYDRIQTWGDSEFKNGLDDQPSKPTSFKFGSNFVREYVYQNSSPQQDITLAESLLRSIPVLDEEIVYSTDHYGKVRRAFIVAKQDKTICEELQRKMIADNPPDRVYEMEESDHSPFFSCPAQLARILQDISEAFN